MSGLRLAMIVGAVIIAASALFAFFALPDRADDDPEVGDHNDDNDDVSAEVERELVTAGG